MSELQQQRDPAAFDADLVRRYDGPGPRYTSYPTAVEFTSAFTADDYVAAAREGGPDRDDPLSLYVHIPFCESPCFYCGCNKVITRDHGRAGPYLQRLALEIQRQGALYPRTRAVDQLHFGGGTPTFLSDAELGQVLADLGSHFTLRTDAAREYSIELDPRTVSADRLNVIAAMGFNRVSLGIQDFDIDVQRAVNREQPAELALALLERARSIGIDSVSVDLIYGLPRQTAASFAGTLERVIAARPDRIAAYSYAHLPHIFKPQRQIKQEDLVSPEEKLAILGLTIESLTAAGYVYIGMDHFALPTDELVTAQRSGTLQRNFQGYSTRADYDMVALGVSAISKVGRCYAQNARNLKDYYERIDAGGLAVEKGLRLTDDDLLRRDVIQRLMCATRLEFSVIESAYGIRFTEYFAGELAALAPLEADRLVVREPGAIVITARGRLLLRNVAMVFDAHLRKAAAGAGTPRFSRVV